MLSRPVLVVVAVVGCLLLVAAAAVAYLVLPPWKSADVAVPKDQASPKQVVRAYLDAVDAHDCDTAKALATEAATEMAAGWCEDVASLDEVVVHDAYAERSKRAWRTHGKDVVDVAVDFDLHWRMFRGDASTAGTTEWGYQLVRTTPGAPWRIADQGTG